MLALDKITNPWCKAYLRTFAETACSYAGIVLEDNEIELPDPESVDSEKSNKADQTD